MRQDPVLGVSTSIFPGESISEQEYALLERFGFRSVEIGYEHSLPALLQPRLGEYLVALCGHHQPPVFSVHAPYTPDRDLSALDQERRTAAVEHAKAALNLAHRLGARLMVIHASEDPIAAGTRADRLAQARASLAVLLPIARALNLRLAVEMMPPEWLPAGVNEAFDLVYGLDATGLGFCLDTNHANLTGDLTEIVRALGSRLWNVHVSDNDGKKQRHWMPLKGVIDWEALLAVLFEEDYTGPLHYELDVHPAGAEKGLEEICENFEHLVALFHDISGRD
jgi:sugar phosphate isomerase/epimerase